MQNFKKNILEWTKSIIFALSISVAFRWFFFDHFEVPTSSMEGTVMTGDHLIVSKLGYGPRIPITPLQIPLSHKEIFGKKSFSDKIKLPYKRIFSLEKVKRGDIIVFNCPYEIEYPLDIREFFLKRCVGIAGDIVEIKESNLYINGILSDEIDVQKRFLIKSDKFLNDSFFKKNQITEYIRVKNGYIANIKNSIKNNLEKKIQLEILKVPKDFVEEKIIFNKNGVFNWNSDNLGPITVPYKGFTISITKENLAIYEFSIKNHENLKNVKIENNSLYINEKIVYSYTFTQDYYFAMGDNRHNSIDSRYWGFIPESHMIGKPKVIIYSKNKNSNGFLDYIRWNRLFKFF